MPTLQGGGVEKIPENGIQHYFCRQPPEGVGGYKIFFLAHITEILLPSAVHLEERLTVSQSVPEPASRQSDRYTQFGFFVSGSCGPKQRGGPSRQSKQWPSGNAAHRHPCGRRFEP